MPALEYCDRNQHATLWNRVDNDAQGQVAVSPAVALDPRVGTGVRWVDKRDEALNSKSAIVGWDATVIVDRRIEVGSIMWKGDIDDLSGTASPGDLYEVKSYYSTPDIKGRNYRHSVGLMRFRDALPTQTLIKAVVAKDGEPP